MPYASVTFPDGTTFSNLPGTDALAAEDHYGLAEGGHDPGMLVMANKLIDLVTGATGTAAISSTPTTPALGDATFALTGAWLPPIGEVVKAYRPDDPATYLLGAVTASAAGSITIDAIDVAGAGEQAPWIITRPGVGDGDTKGATASLDGEILRADGTDGNTLQQSGWVIDDDGTLTAGGPLKLLTTRSEVTSVSASVTPSVSIAAGAGQVVSYLLDGDGEIDLAPAAADEAYFVVVLLRTDGVGSRSFTHKFDGATAHAFEDDGGDYSTETEFANDGPNILRVVGFTVTASRSIMSVGGGLDLS